MLSSISPIGLARESQFSWLLFLLFITLTIITGKLVFMTGDQISNKASILEQEKEDCEREIRSCKYFIDAYKKMYLASINDREKFELSLKIIKYENLAIENQIKITNTDRKIKEYLPEHNKKLKRFMVMLIITLFFLYVALWMIANTILFQFKNCKIYNYCQSCGRKINSISVNYGTEVDQSLSRFYCSCCYKDGKFIKPNLTLAEMESLAKKEMEKKNISLSIIDRKIKSIRKLKRWVYSSEY